MPAITGKHIYDIARKYWEASGLEQIEWDECSGPAYDATKEFYNDIAAKLNEQFVDPLQQEIEKLEMQLDILRRTVSIGMESGQRLEQKIAALQTLVTDFVALLEDKELMILDESDGWWERRRNAIRRAQELAEKQS